MKKKLAAMALAVVLTAGATPFPVHAAFSDGIKPLEMDANTEAQSMDVNEEFSIEADTVTNISQENTGAEEISDDKVEELDEITVEIDSNTDDTEDDIIETTGVLTEDTDWPAAEIAEEAESEVGDIGYDSEHEIDTDRLLKIEKIKESGKPVNYTDLGEENNSVKIIYDITDCEKGGTASVEFYCKTCGEKITVIDGIKINALEHMPADRIDNIQENTCVDIGIRYIISYCERCDKILNQITDYYGPIKPHSNESERLLNGIRIPKDTDEGSETEIHFVGSKVYGKYVTGQTLNENMIGEGEGILEANIYTNCEVCHDNRWPLRNADSNIILTITGVERETYDNSHKVSALGTIHIKASYLTSENVTVTDEITLPYCSDPDAVIADGAKNGLFKDADGIYRYYQDGIFDGDYAGIVEYNNGEFFVANGVLCKDANGLNLYKNEWYMLSYGQIQRDYNGLALYNNDWFYITNGVLNKKIVDLVPYNGGLFLFSGGHLYDHINGLFHSSDGNWYYLANGQVQTQYTGVAMYDNEFFYIKNGILASDFNGTIEYDGAMFKVVAGQLYGPI